MFSELKMSSRKTAGRRGTTKKRAQRATSNVFAMFNQDQIQEFKVYTPFFRCFQNGVFKASGCFHLYLVEF